MDLKFIVYMTFMSLCVAHVLGGNDEDLSRRKREDDGDIDLSQRTRCVLKKNGKMKCGPLYDDNGDIIKDGHVVALGSGNTFNGQELRDETRGNNGKKKQ